MTRHIGKTVRERARSDSAATSGKRAPEGKRRPSRGMFAAVRAHRAFLPLLTVWAALLFGLVVLALPEAMIARFAAMSGIAIAPEMLRFALSGLFALLGGALGFVAASALRAAPARPSSEATVIAAIKARKPRPDAGDVRPIDPAADLGSESLDAPIDEATLEGWRDVPTEAETPQGEDEAQEPAKAPEPTLGELARRGFEMEAPESIAANEDGEEDEPERKWAFTRSHFKDALIESCEGATCEAAASPEHASPEHASPERAVPERETAPLQDKPRALDLAEFGTLPGRNAVWVDEPVPDAVAAAAEDRPGAGPPRPEPVPASALEKLRRKPPEELSLVEMVERFAAALHERQNAERAHAAHAQPGRDAALAEALKALSLFTEGGFDRTDPDAGIAGGMADDQVSRTERELRDALSRLRNLRGAA
jgi:hypothetical protein